MDFAVHSPFSLQHEATATVASQEASLEAFQECLVAWVAFRECRVAWECQLALIPVCSVDL